MADLLLITPEYGYRVWGGKTPLELIEAAFRVNGSWLMVHECRFRVKSSWFMVTEGS